MTSRDMALKRIKEKYSYLTDEFGVVKIGIFGSTAKGTDMEDSDIDVVVELKKPLGLKFIELAEYLETLFNKKVDVLTNEGINNIRIKEISENIKRNIIYV